MGDAPRNDTYQSTFGSNQDPSEDRIVLDDEAELTVEGPVDPAELEQKLIYVLRSVHDPEIPVNVYDLGLIYELSVNPQGAVRIAMTLTAPACPVAGMIVSEVHGKVLSVPGVSRVRTELVWDPPWSMDRMSEAARLQLGLL
jgi:FeS assembly SUF system protein